MPLRFSIPLSVLLFAVPGMAQAQSAQDFQLPPAPTPSSSPQVQGPVDNEADIPIRPRAIPTARATPTPRPSATVRPAPTPTARPTATATPRPIPTSTRPAIPQQQPRPVASAPAQSREQPVETAPTQAPSPLPQSVPTDPAITGAAPPPSTTPAPSLENAEAQDQGNSRLLWLGGLAALIAAAVAVFAWRRRKIAAVPMTIERPQVDRTAAASMPIAEALVLKPEGIKLTRSFANATLAYRITLVNRAKHALRDLTIGGDLISAHGRAPMEEQIAGDATPLELRHTVDRIAPGQTVRLEGQMRLPLASVQVIRQGKSPLLIPLLRLRVDREGDAPLVKTFVIGQGSADGGRVQPFRLDEPPRTYQVIGQRELA